MWLVYANRKAGRTGIWADGYIWANRHAEGYFWRGRAPPTAATFRRALLRDLRQRAALSRRDQTDVHVFLSKADYGQDIDSDRLYEHLREHGDPDFYRQLILTTPYAGSRTRARQIKTSLERLGFRSARGYRYYDELKSECCRLLRDVTQLYVEPAAPSRATEYLAKRNLTLER